ncbi:kinesin, putative [Leishmania donovani]|uniref:Kinesin, putative n=1 Tax=Leishmania donovani TaxID=5661 RepID=E9BD19_LEIDO|nr:kinesin, putative [Leishmania donovani]AYU77745.1 kinesin, putative [Leishmania donovani]CBZ33145.1 kinesin, putative [Leishmania donovani]
MTDGGDYETARVMVSVRVRPKLAHPLTPLQQSERYEKVVCIPSSDKSLRLADCRAKKGTRDLHFAYDHVFDMDATQEDVYEAAVLDCVDSVLAGTNASILTYGQTGSGKTFTVLGKTAVVHDSGKDLHAVGSDTGLLLRSIQDMLIFAERMRAKCERHVVLGMTALEIYMDEIRDLLREGVAGRPLQPIMTRGVLHLPHLTHVPLRTLQDAFHVYERAAARRVQRVTSANDTSSRSHAFFTIEVFQAPITPDHPSPPTLAECCALREARCAASIAAEQKQRGPQLLRSECFEGAANALLGTRSAPVMYSTLTVADLAGSEKAKHAEVRGTGFDELRHINASLTALGNVVHHLYHGTPHIPYRDSKLTMMLRDTFAAPRAQVALFVNVSPTAVTCEETLSSLYFADKIKSMRVLGTGAESPQHAALQSAYLESIYVHDALLAEARIVQVQQEHATGLLQLAAASTPRHPLFQLPFHTPLANGTDKTTRMQVLCTRLRERLAHEESPEARMRNFLETRRRELLRDMLRQYSRRRAEVQTQITTADEAGLDLRAQLSRDESAMRQLLSKVEEAAAAVTATRQELIKVKNMRLGELQRLRDFEEAPNEGEGGIVDAHAAHADDEASLAAFEQERATYKKALELAQLLLTLVGLMAPGSTPSPSAHTDGEPAAGHGRRNTTSRSCRDATSTTASSTPSKPASTEAWLRGAVLAMAGNAVVQSSRKHPRQQRQQEKLQPISLPQPFRIVSNFTNVSGDPQPLPKYWSVCHRCEETGKVEADANAGAVAPDAIGKGTSRRPRHLSSFDDPALLTRVTAYMDMGASLTKLDRYGRPHARWFYLSQRNNRLLLCWDESHRGPGLMGGGRVYLDEVVKITLGRSSPAFRKYSTHERKSEVGDFCTSFTLAYRTRARRRHLKFVDVMCRDRVEVETWVVGLAQLAGVFPCFEGARQPIGPEDGYEEEAAVTGSAAAANADAAAAKEAQKELSAVETVLCRSWHIPAQTMLHTRREIETRRQRHQSGRLRLSPGELRERTGLDIFRASALWLHFNREGSVVNPFKELHCYVSDRVPSSVPASGSLPRAMPGCIA